jgi:hypothetical protein
VPAHPHWVRFGCIRPQRITIFLPIPRVLHVFSFSFPLFSQQPNIGSKKAQQISTNNKKKEKKSNEVCCEKK